MIVTAVQVVFATGQGAARGVASIRSGQPALAPGAAGQMIVMAAVTMIGVEDDIGGLRCGDGVCLRGKALFLAADGEAGAHGGN